MAKISALPNSLTDPEAADLLAVVDDGDDETKKMTLGTLLSLIYPVGSLYFNADADTNPGTLFGFGTWARFAVGRTVVGVNEADSDFEEAGLTGGQKTVQAHAHDIRTKNDDMNFTSSSLGIGPTFADARDGTASLNNFSGIVQSAGSGATNMNPFETAFIWKRTA